MRKSSLWWAVHRLLKSWERIVHVAPPYSIASITSALNSLILSDSRAFRRSYSWYEEFFPNILLAKKSLRKKKLEYSQPRNFLAQKSPGD